MHSRRVSLIVLASLPCIAGLLGVAVAHNRPLLPPPPNQPQARPTLCLVRAHALSRTCCAMWWARTWLSERWLTPCAPTWAGSSQAGRSSCPSTGRRGWARRSRTRCLQRSCLAGHDGAHVRSVGHGASFFYRAVVVHTHSQRRAWGLSFFCGAMMD